MNFCRNGLLTFGGCLVFSTTSISQAINTQSVNSNSSIDTLRSPQGASTKIDDTSLYKKPYFSFKNGLGFATPDSSYSINIRFRIQSRALMNTISDEDLAPESFEARIRRCRLSFMGHVYNPKWSYYLQLSFSRGDMDWSVTDATTQNVSPNIVRDAVIYYKPIKNLQLGFGQTKLPGNRQRTVSSGALQFYDRSPVNSNFTLDRDFGAFINYTLRSGNFKAIIKTAVSSGEGRNSNSSNTGLAYTGRLEILPLGDFTEGGDYFEGDLSREQKLKLSIAGGYHFNDLAVRTQGQLGRDLYEPRSYHVYLADFLLKYKGFALSSEYIKRVSDRSPVTKNKAGATRNLITGDGLNTQLSYCFESRWEIAARHSIVTPLKENYSTLNQINQYGLGVTNYIMKHKVKAQFNVFYSDNRNLATQKDALKNYFAVFQIELGI